MLAGLILELVARTRGHSRQILKLRPCIYILPESGADNEHFSTRFVGQRFLRLCQEWFLTCVRGPGACRQCFCSFEQRARVVFRALRCADTRAAHAVDKAVSSIFIMSYLYVLIRGTYVTFTASYVRPGSYGHEKIFNFFCSCGEMLGMLFLFCFLNGTLNNIKSILFVFWGVV